MLMYGGLTENGASNQMYSYDIVNQSWTDIPLSSLKVFYVLLSYASYYTFE